LVLSTNKKAKMQTKLQEEIKALESTLQKLTSERKLKREKHVEQILKLISVAEKFENL